MCVKVKAISNILYFSQQPFFYIFSVNSTIYNSNFFIVL